MCLILVHYLLLAHYLLYYHIWHMYPLWAPLQDRCLCFRLCHYYLYNNDIRVLLFSPLFLPLLTFFYYNIKLIVYYCYRYGY